jgi:hypothetical protein
MYVYGQVGSNNQLVSVSPIIDDEYIEMNGERPSADHVADENGEWVIIESDVLKTKLNELWRCCKEYQLEDRVDETFAALLMNAKILLSINAVEEAPKCMATLQWLDDLWADYYQRKTIILENTEEALDVCYDFSNHGDNPYVFAECRAELA